MLTKIEKQKIRNNFWEKFAYRSSKTGGQSGLKKRWIMDNTKMKDITLKFDFNENRALVGLILQCRNKAKRHDIFDKLLCHRQKIDSFFSSSPSWQSDIDLQNRIVSGIFIMQEKVSVYRPEDWPLVFDFFFSQMKCMEKMFWSMKPIMEEIIMQYEKDNFVE